MAGSACAWRSSDIRTSASGSRMTTSSPPPAFAPEQLTRPVVLAIVGVVAPASNAGWAAYLGGSRPVSLKPLSRR